GMICASEQAVFVDKEIYAAVKAEFQAHQVYIVKPDELQKLEEVFYLTFFVIVNKFFPFIS
ncbi:hypothetical protein, partial [Enterococcus faecium]|uniref:hypothetical protein n=1 Tax=Enterococcus faecium TaxID=1352 RepID=UPI00292ECAD5